MKIILVLSFVTFVSSYFYSIKEKSITYETIEIETIERMTFKASFFKNYKGKVDQVQSEKERIKEFEKSLTPDMKKFRKIFYDALSYGDVQTIKMIWELRPYRPNEEEVIYYLSLQYNYELTKFFYDEGYPVDDLMNTLEHHKLDRERYYEG